MYIDLASVTRTLSAARGALLDARGPHGNWVGELSSSALSTATATCALAILDRTRPQSAIAALVRGGLDWLAAHQNDDGGWGDTVDSPSNLSTTSLAWAALGINEQLVAKGQAVARRAEAWLEREVGDPTPERIAAALKEAYGEDRTFSVPILTMCALAGKLGVGRAAWQLVPGLPFELAALPRSWFRRLGLPVVSYALPALIALGQVRHAHLPARNPLTRWLRSLTRRRTLRVLAQIQPESGGFLEAAPLTSFVVMSLVAAGQGAHPVVEHGTAFLRASVRADGSWPIDTNLSTWVTTLSMNSLAADGGLAIYLARDEQAQLRTWLLNQQHTKRHPYTQADPGGWAWTDLSGGVPDADDTSGALLALKCLEPEVEEVPPARAALRSAVLAGVSWLLDLQNRDGGIPTFCRGWGRLPFDRSTPDLTAHALRAWSVWQDELPSDLARRVTEARRSAVRYLLQQQRPDGSWIPLWFGNQQVPQQTNPLYGTTRVLRALETLAEDSELGLEREAARAQAVAWVVGSQNADGGWGGAVGTCSTIEETALALDALAPQRGACGEETWISLARGCAWLAEETHEGTHFTARPIGLYFAKLWYSESLYPLIYTLSALGRIRPCHLPPPHGTTDVSVYRR